MGTLRQSPNSLRKIVWDQMGLREAKLFDLIANEPLYQLSYTPSN
jgi:hypothetical protein